MARQGGFYAVRKGRETGIFNTWKECKNQVDGYGGAIYKKFNNYEQAKSFLGHSNDISNYRSSAHTGGQIGKPHTTQKRVQVKNLPPSYYSSLASSSAYSPSRSGNKNTFYSVKSNVPNVESKIFNNWKDCQAYVKHKRGITFKKFEDESAAENFINGVSAHDYKLMNVPKDIFESKYKLSGNTIYDRSMNVYCDGSSFGNGTSSSRAGYGAYFEGAPEENISEPLLSGAQTNNRAEIEAVSEALKKIWDNLTNGKDKVNYQIKTDSEYVAKLLNDRYTTYDNKKLEGLPNSDLIVPLVQRFVKVKKYYELNEECFKNNGKFQIEWVKGHDGDPGNEMADLLAKKGASRR
ncbi:RNA-DNA hybrid ribonuclease [Saccharomyces paradoxus]|uniref:Ribonuclease H n=1 Tax=Saccharomyces paradoxus TaxID=27291 RepID=A0A8B8UXU0_SACPA|nr:Rnh1 [Saccharomyces paradoxus]QHS75506.1 Rnh1 [Saccharomyces paradoxus]